MDNNESTQLAIVNLTSNDDDDQKMQLFKDYKLILCEALRIVENKIWKKSIRREEMGDYRQSMQVISSHMEEGNLVVHVFSENQPGSGFEQIPAELEDVYFSTITKN